MIDLTVKMEIEGRDVRVGSITGNRSSDAVFRYSEEYVRGPKRIPLSLSLPVQEEPFSAARTKNYFDGLLPEGFTRRTIAGSIRASEDDYIAILTELGRECLGAIKIIDGNEDRMNAEAYEELDMEKVKALAAEGASRSAEMVTESRLSLTGASGKAGLYYDRSKDKWYLPKGSAPSTHIVKQSHIRLDGIVTNEQLCMSTAAKLGLDVPESFIINTGQSRENEVLYAVERYDRCIDEDCRYVSGLPAPHRLHQEDFAQAMGVAAADKYEAEGGGYFHSMIEILRRYSVKPADDILKLFDAAIFNFLIGNTDCHIKNFSLLRDKYGKGIRLAPLYDLLSTTIYERNTRNMAFAVNGVYSVDMMGRRDFLEAALKEGLSQRLIGERFDHLKSEFPKALNSAAEELLEMGFFNAADIRDRIMLSAENRIT